MMDDGWVIDEWMTMMGIKWWWSITHPSSIIRHLDYPNQS
jgi:hypothetical protein